MDLLPAFQKAVALIQEKREQHFPQRARCDTWALAYSGGLDSSVLLDLAHRAGLGLHVIHVNHGLQSEADAWQVHCENKCRNLDIKQTSLVVEVKSEGLGVEASARLARYNAIGLAMIEHSLSCLLVAHHHDDHLETVLLQLLRGSGLRGVAGLDEWNRHWPCADPCFKNAYLSIGRPLLQFDQSALRNYAKWRNLTYIQDPSNLNTNYRRNWVRHELMPQLQAQFPQANVALSRLSEHFRTYYNSAESSTEMLLSQVQVGARLNLQPWSALVRDQQIEVLRLWLLQQGVRCGRDALLELHRQLQPNTPKQSNNTDTKSAISFAGGIKQVKGGFQVRVKRGMAELLKLLT